VVAGLPVAAAAAAGAGLWRTAARAKDGLPTGEAAALLAAEAVARSWSRPTGWVVALLQHLQRNQLRWLLVSYAGVHAARLGLEAGAAHMLSVGDVVSRRSSGFAVSASWNDGAREDFDPAKFAMVWRLARVIELERGVAQVARLGAVREVVS